MRAVRRVDDSVRVVEVPAPSGEGVRVRVASAGICGSDLHLIDGPFPIAATLGHEVAGYLPGGRLSLLATYWEGMELPGIALCMKELNVIPASMYSAVGDVRDVDTAARILARRPELADILITHRFPLDAAVEAFETARDRTAGAIKVVLEP